jgi:hypothetical protein
MKLCLIFIVLINLIHSTFGGSNSYNKPLPPLPPSTTGSVKLPMCPRCQDVYDGIAEAILVLPNDSPSCDGKDANFVSYRRKPGDPVINGYCASKILLSASNTNDMFSMFSE